MGKMKNNITELVFILDRSGSMSGLESDTIGGFNSMLKKQKKKSDKCYVSTVLFDSSSTVLHDRLDIADVPLMTDRDYEIQGCTALMDALGGAIRHIGNIHKYARREDVPENTVFFIITDGMENASMRYSADYVRQLVEKQKKKYGWEFIFIGANIDAVRTASSFGISSDRAVNYHADRQGTDTVYANIDCVISEVRACAPISADWAENINRDYKTRKH